MARRNVILVWAIAAAAATAAVLTGLSALAGFCSESAIDRARRSEASQLMQQCGKALDDRKMDEAIALAKQAIAAAPQHYCAYYLLSNVYNLNGEFRKALDCVETAEDLLIARIESQARCAYDDHGVYLIEVVQLDASLRAQLGLPPKPRQWGPAATAIYEHERQ